MLAMLGNYCYDSSQLVSNFGDIGTDPFKKDRSIVSQAIINLSQTFLKISFVNLNSLG